MSSEIFTITPENTLYEAARIMGEKHIGSLIVMKYETAVGIVTERDLLTKFLAQDKSLKIAVGKACSSPLITVPLSSCIHDAAAVMTSKHIKRIPITKDNKLIGILSARDLVEAYARAK